MRRSEQRIRRTRRGDFELRLPSHERDVLRTLPRQLRDLLSTRDPALARLFPPAYADDPERDAEYERMVRGDLVAARQSSLQVMEESIDAKRLTEEQLVAWLGALNDLRLVLGTRLDVTEDLSEDPPDPAGPEAAAHALYFYLGWLEEQAVDALASGLDPAGTG
jgi:hypothetical protein